MPTYNGEKYIKESIESVLCQSFEDFEFIIVNDCSSDGTLSIIEDYAKKDARIKVISNPENIKLPESLNVGFSAARGEYLTWTSDDNKFKNNAFAVMNEYLDAHENISLVSCAMDYIDENGKFISSTEGSKKEEVHIA